MVIVQLRWEIDNATPLNTVGLCSMRVLMLNYKRSLPGVIIITCNAGLLIRYLCIYPVCESQGHITPKVECVYQSILTILDILYVVCVTKNAIMYYH